MGKKKDPAVKCLEEINESLKKFNCLIVSQPDWAKGADNNFGLKITTLVVEKS